jgi:hypothetical protein
MRLESSLFADGSGCLYFPVTTPLLPAEFDGAEVRFACFLDDHRQWLEDPHVTAWSDFIEDPTADRADELLHLLNEGPRRLPSRQLQILVAGADRSLVLLASMFEVADAGELPYLAAFYGNWLADFFGLGRRSSGALQSGQRNVNWAEALEQSDWFIQVKSEALDAEGPENVRRQLRERLVVLAKASEQARMLYWTFAGFDGHNFQAPAALMTYLSLDGQQWLRE